MRYHSWKRAAGLLGSLVILTTAVCAAQRSDEARLTMGISAGLINGGTLWSVPNQPIASVFDSPDIFALSRDIRSDLTVSGHATYYGSPHLGITGQFTYLGLGATDNCALVVDGGDAELEAACFALRGDHRSASAVTVQGGFTYRPLAHSALQPYVTGLVGVAFTPISMVEMAADYGIDSTGTTPLSLTVYDDDHWHSIRPSYGFALGIATAPASGYQIRAEFRDTFLGVPIIDGPTIGQGFVPAYHTTTRGFTSIVIGFDVVLERLRGRRY